ncbi:glycosyltransferase family 2 protein [Coprobacter tertius]|uniref:Glycosyltransferase family 2 protein n=1 Tax=Coprobacter tertius TaxID=2944915 RepID=A0ABT1ME85_9BACT|nr:glycosyltransferase family 2 protein [Coprobacter tertius]MCP9610942.1 glycosyltransferase family 2 protein [Coprobacter tertius]
MIKDLVSVILVNYNGFKDTCEIVDSLKSIETYPYEIIVVDNASDNGEGDRLQKQYPEISVICSNRNLGFAGGNNLGIGRAKGEFLFFLNNDTILTRPVLEILAGCLKKDKQLGCVSPKTTFWPENSVLQYAGATPMSRITLRNEFIGYNRKDDGSYDIPCKTSFPNGAAMMIRHSDVEKFGLMPNLYFLYYEELDWCVQMQKAGFYIWYEPRAVVAHKESASVGLQSPLQVYYHTRNRLIFVRRTIVNRYERIVAYAYQLVCAVPKRFVFFLVSRKYRLLKPLLKGACDGIKAVCSKRLMLW